MNEWIERAYILTLDYYRGAFNRFAKINKYGFEEASIGRWAIREVLNKFELPEDSSPLVIACDFYQHLEAWGKKEVLKGEWEVANVFLTAFEVVRDLSDFLAGHGLG